MLRKNIKKNKNKNTARGKGDAWAETVGPCFLPSGAIREVTRKLLPLPVGPTKDTTGTASVGEAAWEPATRTVSEEGQKRLVCMEKGEH